MRKRLCSVRKLLFPQYFCGRAAHSLALSSPFLDRERGPGSIPALEIKEAKQGACLLIERLVANSSQLPIVLNEAEDRRLVSNSMIDRIYPRKRRNGKQRQARTVAAASLKCTISRHPAAPRSSKRINARHIRLVKNRAHHVVVPAIRVIPGDDHGRTLPFIKLLQAINRVHQKMLLIEWVRISCVAILVSRGL